MHPEAPPNFWGDMPEVEYYTSVGVHHSKSYCNTPNGKIFTQSFLPLNQNQPIKATVFMTHGYGSDTGWLFQKICINFATWGYAVFAADLLGHGRSDGIRCYLGDLHKVAATSLYFFKSVRNNEEYKNLSAFLFGESLGGLATLLMYFQSEPETWTGLIFSAPLFVIPEPMKPSKMSNNKRKVDRAEIEPTTEYAYIRDKNSERNLRRRIAYNEKAPEKKAALLERRRAEYAARKRRYSENSAVNYSAESVPRQNIEERFPDMLLASLATNLLFLVRLEASAQMQMKMKYPDEKKISRTIGESIMSSRIRMPNTR